MIDRNELSSLVRLFISTDRMHKAYVDRYISGLGIHRSQHMILMYLARAGNLPSQKELAEHLNVSPAAVAVALKTLEADGYITKESGTEDGRFKRVVITELGIKTVEKSRDIFYKIDLAMCRNFTDSELDDLKVYLEKMRQGLISLDMEESKNEKMD